MSGPQRFRKKPVEIEAWQWSRKDQATDIVVWIAEEGECTPATYDGSVPGASGLFGEDWGCLEICTLEGRMEVAPWDFVIRGVRGEFYPCKPDIFEATYEAVS